MSITDNDPGGLSYHGDFIDGGYTTDFYATAINHFSGPDDTPVLQGVMYRVYGKPVFDGVSWSVPVIGDFSRTISDVGAFSMRVARIRGIGSAVTDGPELLFAGIPFGAGPFTTLKLQAIAVDDTVDPPVLVPSEYDLPVPSWSPPTRDAPQPGSCTVSLDVSSGELLDLEVLGDRAYAAHVVNEGQGTPTTGDDHTLVRWYEWLVSPKRVDLAQIVQTGTLDVHDFNVYPSMAVNGDGEVGVVFAALSATQTSRLYVTGRSPCDPPGFMAPPVEVAQSASCFNSNGGNPGRMGDYYKVAALPNGRRFWAVGQLFDTPDTWQTHVQEFHLSADCPDCTCTADPGGGPTGEPIEPNQSF